MPKNRLLHILFDIGVHDILCPLAIVASCRRASDDLRHVSKGTSELFQAVQPTTLEDHKPRVGNARGYGRICRWNSPLVPLRIRLTIHLPF